MSVTKRTSPTGTVYYRVRWRDPDSQERNFKTARAAARFDRDVHHDIDHGTYRNPRLAKITFAEWHARWWPTMQDRAPNTIAQYENILRLHVLPHLGPRRLGSIRRIDLEEWVSDLRRAPGSAHRRYGRPGRWPAWFSAPLSSPGSSPPTRAAGCVSPSRRQPRNRL